MPRSFSDRLRHAWNVFRELDDDLYTYDLGPSYGRKPDRVWFSMGTERSMVLSLYNRISIDVSALAFRHVRLDQNGRFLETIDSSLNECLSVAPNKDQISTSFVQDIVLSLFDEGVVAIVPVDTSFNPAISGSYDIQSMRVGKVIEWFPNSVRVELYNDRTGMKEQIYVPKSIAAIVENPLYAVMNEPNSTLKRLISKLNLLDAIDNQSGSGKLNLIFQLPYVIKTAARKEQADIRRQDIEKQLADTKYGIAYVDATEKITQLNRPVENNLMGQIEFLTSMLYSQLGITQAVLDGTADEKTMINYHNRTVGPVATAIAGSMKRTFLTKTARTQGQSISFFKDAFVLVPASEIATISDSLTRNAILTSNEIRSVLGYKPSSDKDADTLRNKNLNPEKSVNNEVVNSDTNKGVTINE